MSFFLLLTLLLTPPAWSFAPPNRTVQPRTSFHSHNDYEREVPLQNAIDGELTSVEADVWLVDGRVMVSHYGVFFTGSLESLYLAPLQKRIQEKGSVYGDRKPFYLWIEIKEPTPELVHRLHDLLSHYPMLTRFTPLGIRPGPVTAVLTGLESSKQYYMENYKFRVACRDSETLDASDASASPNQNAWLWYSIPWKSILGAAEPLTPKGLLAIQRLVELSHRKGRKLRIYDVPEDEGIWSDLLRKRVDLISVDQLGRLGRFLSSVPSPRP